MKRTFLCLILFAASAFAEVDKTQMDLFKKESAVIRAAIDDAMNGIVPGRGVTQAARASYLEGYGAVFTLEASLEPTRSPFTSPKSPAEVRAVVAERRKAIEAKLDSLLKQRAGSMQSLQPTDSVTIVVYLFNSNPVDVPDLPSQILFTVKKLDPTQLVIQAF
jgi:hypothetical protein